MVFPASYKYGMTPEEIRQWWANLKPTDFHFTSRKKKTYNCLRWAMGKKDIWVDMDMIQQMHNLDPATLDHSANGYAECLNKYYGYEICENGDSEEGFEKVALYEKNGDWTHIARLLPNGHWTSKMGKLEDIEHYTLESLSGRLYGKFALFMRKPV